MRAILGVYLQADTRQRDVIAAVGCGRGVLQAGPWYYDNKMRLFSQNYGCTHVVEGGVVGGAASEANDGQRGHAGGRAAQLGGDVLAGHLGCAEKYRTYRKIRLLTRDRRLLHVNTACKPAGINS
jgi:hypothetical protein